MKGLNWFLTCTLAAAISGCGGSSGESDSNSASTPDDSSSRQQCTEVAADIQWDTLKTKNAEYLSEFKLFQNSCNPTSSPNARGLAYDLSVPLFTDYASKYRFVFIPPNTKATYSENETFEFPVGSVLAKTFTLPSDTSERGFDKENLIETRLLIKRDIGWVSLPYVWNAEKTDAVLTTSGTSVATTLQHGNDSIDFDYGVPTFSQCNTCHQFNPGGNKDYVKDNDGNVLNKDGQILKDEDGTWYLADADGNFVLTNTGSKTSSIPAEIEEAYFSPIGPKARYLNSNYDYGSGDENQLAKWVSEGLLNAITDEDIDSTPVFHDDVSVDSLTTQQLDDNAKAWLDINCGHCHRLEGTASNTTFKSAYWADSHKNDGTCKEAVSGADGSISTIMIPGDAVNSLVFHRINTADAGVIMPPIGRALIHQEGADLIERWLDTQTGACSH